MNVSRSNFVFPSYSKIRQELAEKQTRAYEATIRRLNSKLKQMNNRNDFSADHEKIKNCILSMSTQNMKEKTLVEKQNLVWTKEKQGSHSNQESLNYYIEDDKEEQNNYETYLKFKKKIIERDLEEDRFDKLSGKQKKKQQQEEEQLFKNLYQNQREIIDHSSKNKNKPDIKRIKNNAAQFYKKIQRISCMNKRSSQRPISQNKQYQKTQEQMQLNDLREKIVYEKNKKFLTQNYMQILKKMDNTNIVKWRMLNTQDKA